MPVFQLRQYIRSVLAEGAVTPQQAAKQGLALYINRDGSSTDYVLYDATKLIDIVELGADVPIVSCMKAMMNVDRPEKGVAWGAVSVSLSAAERGFGPLMYDIVMTQEGGLMADRGPVKPAAKKVWQYYKDQRPDVEAKLLDDKWNPKTAPTIDDGDVHPEGAENPLNYAYFATRKLDITQLRKNHYSAIKQLEMLEFDIDDLQQLAVVYFSKRYSDR